MNINSYLELNINSDFKIDRPITIVTPESFSSVYKNKSYLTVIHYRAEKLTFCIKQIKDIFIFKDYPNIMYCKVLGFIQGQGGEELEYITIYEEFSQEESPKPLKDLIQLYYPELFTI